MGKKKGKKGKLIALEGGEGAGKSSMIKFLKKMFSQRRDIVFTREPGGTDIGFKIREILMHEKNKKITGLTELFLFCADRTQHISEVIIPALESGRNVITDRFDRSTIAYQIVARGIEDINVFSQLNSIAKQGVKPDGIIYLDVTPRVGLERKSKSKDGKCTKFDNESLKFHQAVRRGFKKYGRGTFKGNWKYRNGGGIDYIFHIINTTYKSEEEVKQEVLTLVNKILAE
jgi:dTMP kinase